MKQFIIPIAFAVCILAPSCKKKQCWTCTTRQTYSGAGSGYMSPSSSTTSVCDKTEKEIREYEKQASSTSTASSGGYTSTVTITTTCN